MVLIFLSNAIIATMANQKHFFKALIEKFVTIQVNYLTALIDIGVHCCLKTGKTREVFDYERRPREVKYSGLPSYQNHINLSFGLSSS